MYNTTLKVLGDRLKQIREFLKITQKELATKINCKQNAISNLELGKSGSITLLCNLLNFYSDFVYIDLIFSEKFYLISNREEEEGIKSHYSSIVVEIIKQAAKQHEKKLASLTDELQEDLEKAINLLSH